MENFRVPPGSLSSCSSYVMLFFMFCLSCFVGFFPVSISIGLLIIKQLNPSEGQMSLERNDLRQNSCGEKTWLENEKKEMIYRMNCLAEEMGWGETTWVSFGLSTP